MADHGYPQDVKVNMTHDDDPPPFSDEAAVPLLAGEKNQGLSDPDLPRGRCPFRGRFRRGNCTSEQRAQRNHRFPSD